jgi:HAD superfamily (subfamily IA) hydrolase, TIGR02254
MQKLRPKEIENITLKKYEIFLFDADGTLFDYDKAETNALKTMFAAYKLNYTESIRLKYRELNAQAWKSYEQGEITKAELQTLRFCRLFDYVGVKQDEEIFNEKYLHELGKGAFLINGALEICKDIVSHGKKIYLATNGILATQKSRLKHSAIKDYISGFFVSEEIGFQKPHPSYFKHVFAHIPPIDKSKILMIGDSLSTDIVGGNAAEIDTCWLNIHKEPNTTNITPTYEIPKLSELSRFI